MKIIILLLFASVCYGQDSVVFSRSEITILANKYREYKHKALTADTLIPMLERSLAVKDTIIAVQQNYVDVVRRENDFYRLTEKMLRNEIQVLRKKAERSWYESPFLYFGLGVLTTILITK